MSEESIWSGSPSQVKNIGTFIFCSLLAVGIAAAAVLFWQQPLGAALALLPVLYAFIKWLRVKSQRFEITNERLLTSRGIFSRITETLELYRVKDMRLAEPFSLRAFGLQNIELVTSDTTSPRVVIDHIPAALKLSEKLRVQVEACRLAKGTREVDMQ